MVHAAPRPRGFNSASTLSSRRTPPVPSGEGGGVRASIRPRRCRRGEHARPRRLGRTPVRSSIRPRRCRRGKQPGYSTRNRRCGCFNSASTLSSRRTWLTEAHPMGTVALQFGLDAVVEENVGVWRWHHRRGAASIRPRRCRRGEHRLPRPEGEGREGLQFGLDAVVEENPATPADVRTAAGGFNSASTLSSRRTGSVPAFLPACHALQFGLDAVVEENARVSEEGGRSVTRFNSASTLSSRRTRLG